MKKEASSEPVIEDGDNYSGPSDGLSMKFIVLEQFRRCTIEGSKAMAGVEDPRGVKNQAETFINSVIVMEAVLIPYFMQKDNKDLLNKNQVVDREISSINRACLEETKEYKKRTSKSGYNARIVNTIQTRHEHHLIKTYYQKLSILSMLLSNENFFEVGGAIS